MKAITQHQPYASLTALEEKGPETRPRAMRHRGPLAIHAAKECPLDVRDLRFEEPFLDALWHPAKYRDVGDMPPYAYRPDDPLPLGVVLAVTVVVDCVPVEEVGRLEKRGNARPSSKSLWISEKEWAFGDYRPGLGRHAMILAHTHLLPYAVPARGFQALGWEWTPEDPDIAQWLSLWALWQTRETAAGVTASERTEEAYRKFAALDRRLRERGRAAKESSAVQPGGIAISDDAARSGIAISDDDGISDVLPNGLTPEANADMVADLEGRR